MLLTYMYCASDSPLLCWIKYSIITQPNFGSGCTESTADTIYIMLLFSNKQIINVIHDRCFTASSEIDVAESIVLHWHLSHFYNANQRQTGSGLHRINAVNIT